MATEVIELRWKDLYRIAGIAAIISEAIILLGLVTYFYMALHPGKETTENIFQFLQSNKLAG